MICQMFFVELFFNVFLILNINSFIFKCLIVLAKSYQFKITVCININCINIKIII